MFFAYVKEERDVTPTLECLYDGNLIDGFVSTLQDRGLQASTITCYLDNLKYGLRYLYTKANKSCSEQDHYLNVSSLAERYRKQTAHSTAHHSWQALAAKGKWAEW